MRKEKMTRMIHLSQCQAQRPRRNSYVMYVSCGAVPSVYESNIATVVVQALREAQLNSQRRQEENTDLKRKLDAVTQQLPKRRRKHAQESTEFDEEIAKLGRMFAVMYE